MKRLLRVLHDYWFAPASLRELAIVRIVLVASQLFVLMPDIGLRYQLWLARSDSLPFQALPTLKALMLPFGWGVRPEPMFLQAVWLVYLVTGVTALIGLYARPSLLLFAATNTLIIAHIYSYGEAHHREAIMIVALWAIAFAPCARALSVDALRERARLARRALAFAPHTAAEEMSPYARWPLLLVQWMFVLIYLSAATSKLRWGGFEWLNGYTLAYYAAHDGITRNAPLGVWVAQHPGVAGLLSVGALLFELTFVLALIPRLAWIYVAAGYLVHLGIWFTQKAPFFQYLFVYVVFIESLRRFGPLRKRGPAPVWTVIYDGLCPLCLRSMAILDELDGRRCLRYLDLERQWDEVRRAAPGLTPDQARAAMHVIAPDGRIYRGFFAFRALARALPILWPILPFLYLPLAAQAGPWIYRRVAESRSRHPCRAETCAI